MCVRERFGEIEVENLANGILIHHSTMAFPVGRVNRLAGSYSTCKQKEKTQKQTSLLGSRKPAPPSQLGTPAI
jgi:hypothetical protein